MTDSKSGRSGKQETGREMVDVIRRFVDGNAGPYEWDDVMGIACRDQLLESFRARAEDVFNDDDLADESRVRRFLEIAREIEAYLSREDDVGGY